MLILAMNPAAVEMMIPPALVNATAGAAIEFLAGRSLGHISVTTLVLEVLKSMSLLRYAKAATVLIAVMATVSAGIVLGQKPGDEAGTAKPVIPARDVPTSTVKAGKFRVTITERGMPSPARR